MSTLDFASRAKCIRNKAKLNLFVTPETLRNQVEAENVRLREEVFQLRLDLLQAEKQRSLRSSLAGSRRDVDAGRDDNLPAGRKRRPPSLNIPSLLTAFEKGRKRRGLDVAVSLGSELSKPKRGSLTPPAHEHQTMSNVPHGGIQQSPQAKACLANYPAQGCRTKGPLVTLFAQSIVNHKHKSIVRADPVCIVVPNPDLVTGVTFEPDGMQRSAGNNGARRQKGSIATLAVQRSSLLASFPPFVSQRAEELLSPSVTMDESEGPVIPPFSAQDDKTVLSSKSNEISLSISPCVVYSILPLLSEKTKVILSRSRTEAYVTYCPGPYVGAAPDCADAAPDAPLLRDDDIRESRLRQERDLLVVQVQEARAALVEKTDALALLEQQMEKAKTKAAEYRARIDEFETSAALEMQKLAGRLNAQFAAEKAAAIECVEHKAMENSKALTMKFRSDALAEREALMADMNERVESALRTLKQDLEATAMQEQDVLKTQFLKDQENLLVSLAAQHAEHLVQAREDAAAMYEEERRLLQKKLDEERDQLVQSVELQATAKREEMLAKWRQDTEMELECLKQEQAEAVATLITTHTAALEVLNKDHQNALGACRREYEERIVAERQTIKKQMKAELYEAKERVYNLEGQLESLQDQLHNQAENFTAELQAARNEIVQLQRLVDENAFVVEEREFLRTSLVQLTKEFENSKTEHTTRLEEEHRHCLDLQKSLRDCEQRCAVERQHRIEQLEAELRKAKLAYEEAEAAHETDLSRIELQLRCLQDTRDSLVEELTRKDQELAAASSEVASCGTELQALKNKVTSLDAVAQQRQVELRLLQAELAKAEECFLSDQAELRQRLDKQRAVSCRLRDQHQNFLQRAAYHDEEMTLWDALVTEAFWNVSVTSENTVHVAQHSDRLCDVLFSVVDDVFFSLALTAQDICDGDALLLTVLPTEQSFTEAEERLEFYNHLFDESCHRSYTTSLCLELCCLTASGWCAAHQEWTARQTVHRKQLADNKSAMELLKKNYEDQQRRERHAALQREKELDHLLMVATAGRSSAHTFKDVAVDTSDIPCNIQDVPEGPHTGEVSPLELKLQDSEARYQQLVESSEKEKLSLEERIRSAMSLTESYKRDAQSMASQVETLQLDLDRLRSQISADRDTKLELEDKVRRIEMDVLHWKAAADEAKEELNRRVMLMSETENARRPLSRYAARSVLKKNPSMLQPNDR